MALSPSHTGAVLFKCQGRLGASEAQWRDTLKRLAAELPLGESAAMHAAVEGDQSYVYLFSREPGAITPAVLDRLARRAGAEAVFKGVEIHAARLRPLFDVAGASGLERPLFHYVVEMDVVPEHEADLNAWYDKEHMPGLAACPGSVRARRFRNPEGSPRYHSCYDLVRTETVGSPPWLAVRQTAWSDRVRPHFRNLKRTMFKRLFEIAL
ncbi:MAG TPA: hypothetical protein VE034_04395 [Burkholderiales bacterium]|nr:hypothetical protein [Burkholderiales bacterium]